MAEPQAPKKKRLNLAQKRAVKAASVQLFVQRYGRRAQKGAEPNDRRYERKTERVIRRLKPTDLDGLMRGDEE
jgi:hypothetical protein